MNQNYRLRSWMLAICSVVIAASAAPNCGACGWDYPIWMIRSKSADPLYRFIRDGKAGYIDRDGKIIIEPKLDFFSNKDGEFHDGLLLTNSFDGRFTNTFGKAAFEKRYYVTYDFSEGLALVSEEWTGKWGYINTAGDSV